MSQGRSKHFPGRLTQLTHGGSLNPFQEAAITESERDGLMGRDMMLPPRSQPTTQKSSAEEHLVFILNCEADAISPTGV